MQIVLTPAQLHLIVTLNNGTIPFLPNPFRGWLASEIERSMIQAGVLLVREQFAVYQNTQLLLSNDVLNLIQPAVRSQHALVLQVMSNVDTTLFYGFYRMSDPMTGVFIARAGVNVYVLENKTTHQVIRELMQYIGIPEHIAYTPLAPFQISRQNVERIVRRNPDAQQAVRAYDIIVMADGHQQTHRIMFIRNQWWYATLTGDDYRFDPIDGSGLFHLLGQCATIEQRVS